MSNRRYPRNHTAPIKSDARVIVRIAEDEQTGKVYFRVQVMSRVKPRLSAIIRVTPEADGLYSPRDVRRAIATAGGAAAEYLCSNYGETVDPDKVAQAALEAFEDLCVKMSKNPLSAVVSKENEELVR